VLTSYQLGEIVLDFRDDFLCYYQPLVFSSVRLDKLLYLGVASEKDAQENILQALTRKFHLKPNTSIKEIAALCPNNLTGTFMNFL
jgi:hypothetical protein